VELEKEADGLRSRRRSMRRLSRRWSSSWRQTSADSKTTIHIYERDMIIKHASK